MHNSSDDEIIILSQDDADDITQAVRDLNRYHLERPCAAQIPSANTN